MQSFRRRVPRQPSARLTHGPKLDTSLWLLRCSVLRGTPMAFPCNYFRKLNFFISPGHVLGFVDIEKGSQVRIPQPELFFIHVTHAELGKTL